MTTQAVPGGDGRQWRPWARRALRLAMLAGHYSLWLLLPWAGLAVARDITGRPSWMTWIETAAQVILFAALVTDRGYHHARLCERCAGATPLDPQAAVERWKPALRRDHQDWFMFRVLSAGIAWSIGTGYALVSGVPAAGLAAHRVLWAYLLQDLPVMAVVAGYYIVSRVHRNLYPWCPWCHWDHGGEHEAVPDPDPEDHGVKPGPA